MRRVYSDPYVPRAHKAPSSTVLAMVVLLAAAGRLAATSESPSALSNAGSIAAIVAGAIATLLLVWGILRWAKGADIDHGLHIEQPKIRFDVRLADVDLYVGLDVRNGLPRPLAYRPAVFTLWIGGVEHSIPEADQNDITLGPGQPKSWFRDPVQIRQSDLPQTLKLEYRLMYGRSPGSYRRVISGSYEMMFYATDLRPGTDAGLLKVERPELDTRLKWCER
jgi:hypothetical protein